MNLGGGLGGALGQGAHLVGDHGKATAGVTRSGRLDGGIEREQVGLVGDPADHLQDLADASAITLQAADDVRRAGDLVAHVGDGGDGAAHHRFALLGGMVGIVGSLRGFGGMPRDFLGGRGHLVHCRGDLVGTRELLASAIGHQPGDGVQLAAGTVQIRGALLQAGEGVGEEIAQHVGGGGEAAQFVAAAGIHAVGELALAEARDVLDQVANRFDDPAIDQPQAEQRHHHTGEDHDDRTEGCGGLCVGTDGLRALRGGVAQLFDQLAQLSAGGPVDTGYRGVPGERVAVGGNVGIQALAIGNAESAVLATQALDLLGQLRFVGGQYQ